MRKNETVGTINKQRRLVRLINSKKHVTIYGPGIICYFGLQQQQQEEEEEEEEEERWRWSNKYG